MFRQHTNSVDIPREEIIAEIQALQNLLAATLTAQAETVTLEPPPAVTTPESLEAQLATVDTVRESFARHFEPEPPAEERRDPQVDIFGNPIPF